ncbi:hypothetical protein [uncultured Jatrophihabitans sp.]
MAAPDKLAEFMATLSVSVGRGRVDATTLGTDAGAGRLTDHA